MNVSVFYPYMLAGIAVSKTVLILVAVALILLSILLIAAILLQSGSKAGLGAISGAVESFYAKGKSKGMDQKLALITRIVVLVVIAVSILFVFFN